jgi:hypothetical protein
MITQNSVFLECVFKLVPTYIITHWVRIISHLYQYKDIISHPFYLLLTYHYILIVHYVQPYLIYSHINYHYYSHIFHLPCVVDSVKVNLYETLTKCNAKNIDIYNTRCIKYENKFCDDSSAKDYIVWRSFSQNIYFDKIL